MKQALIIGSTVADVTVRLPHLPVTGEDVIVESQSMSLGGCAYVCGLELDEDTGSVIRDNLEEYPEYTVYFAPGPRISFIPQSSLRRMFSLSPILHLNREEALEYTGITGSPENKKPWKKADLPCREGRLEACLPEAASRLTALTRNHVIITLGAHGAFHMEPGRHCFRHLL